ncbi:MAG TPA: hypothetical protein P5140_05865 [Methanofastidiosum sp.]|nr:hypothetical protein [Methanofastidiosum sp.]
MPRPRPDLPEEEVQKLVEEAQKQKEYPICGYVSLKSDGAITVCKMKAGWGTQHPGVGYCRKHGGVGRPIVTGLYLKYKPGEELKTLYQKAQELHVKQIQDHLETLRLIKVVVTELSQTVDLNPVRVDELLKSLTVLLKAEELQLKAQEKNMFTMEQVLSFVGQIIRIIEETVEEPALITKLLMKIKEKVVLFERGEVNE